MVGGFGVEAVRGPGARVIGDVLTDLGVGLGRPNDVLPIVTLPESSVKGRPVAIVHTDDVLARRDGLESTNDVAEQRPAGCLYLGAAGNHKGWPYGALLEPNDGMEVVWHHDIGRDRASIEPRGHRFPDSADHLTGIAQAHRAIGGSAEAERVALRADGDEVEGC